MAHSLTGELRLASFAGVIRIIDEPCHTFGSADNVRKYQREIDQSDGYFGAMHGVFINDVPSAVIRASGGATAVHSHSALVLDDHLFIAVGHRVTCFSLTPFNLEWSVEADFVTCFGLHYSAPHDALICHGELEISRLSRRGEIIWSAGGRDIFTGEFTLARDFVEAHDFDDRRYRFSYETGVEIPG